DDETMRATGEPSVSYQRDLLTKSGTHNCRRGLKHLRHTGSTFWPYVPDHNNISALHSAVSNSFDQFKLSVEHTRRAFKFLTFFAGNLCYRTASRKVAIQDLQVSRCFDRFFKRYDYVLRCEVERRNILKVFANCLTRNRHTITVKESFVKQIFHHNWNTANAM